MNKMVNIINAINESRKLNEFKVDKEEVLAGLGDDEKLAEELIKLVKSKNYQGAYELLAEDGPMKEEDMYEVFAKWFKMDDKEASSAAKKIKY